MKKISILTPTYNRESYLRNAHKYFSHQTYANLEWLILDDSPMPSAYFEHLADPRIQYFHLSDRRYTLGEKLNWLIERASGEIIAHFDDDDYYAPMYISTMYEFLESSQSDLINLRGFFIYHELGDQLWFWDLELKLGMHYEMTGAGVRAFVMKDEIAKNFADNHLGYGFAYMYKKNVWMNAPFPNQTWNCDGVFALEAQKKFKLAGLKDSMGICLHVIHETNSSKSFPQYPIPDCLVENYFLPETIQQLKRN
jgi:glycosyltransferase involved in cell wall biosynthesis